MSRRHWRWVTRDKHTEYEDTVSIWPGLKRPTFKDWERDSCNRPQIDFWQEQEAGDVYQHSIDIDSVVFKKLNGLSIQRGSCQKVVFSAEPVVSGRN